MRMTKKLISILLTVCMLMTSISLIGTAFAATAPAEKYQALAAALKNENVANATYNVNGANTTVTDTTGDVLKALQAYIDVYNAEVINRPAGSLTEAPSGRCTQQIASNIITNIQNTYMTAAEFSTYKTGTVLNAFKTKVSGDDGTSTSSGNSTVDATVKVTLADELVLADYTDAASLPAKIENSYTYTFSNSRSNKNVYTVTTGSGCNAKETKYYYYLASAVGAPTTGNLDTTNIKTFAADVETYGDYYTATLAELVATDADTLRAVSNKLSTDYAKVSVAAYTKFFSDYDTAGLIQTITAALDIATFTAIFAREAELAAVDYSAYTKQQLLDLTTEFDAKLATINAAADQIKDYFGYNDDVKAAYTAKAAELKRAYQLCALREFKADTVDPAYTAYAAYDEDGVTANDETKITKAMLTTAKGEIQGYLNTLANTYDEANVIEVFGSEYLAAINALNENLAYLIDLADDDIAFANKYAYFVETVYAAVDLDDADEALLDQVKAYDTWFAELKEFEAELTEEYGAELAAKIFDGLDAEMNEKLTEKYAVLEARLKAQVDVAWLLLDEAKVAYGGEVTIVSIETFGKLYKAIGALNKDLAAFLKATSNYDLDTTIEAEYDELCAVVFDDYNEFLESGGYDQFETIETADIVRKVAEDEEIRNEDYTVTDEKLEGIIDLISDILASDELKALGVDLASVITPDLINGIYSDSVINSIVQYVYPVVAKEFAKVWADLPTNVEADNPIGSGKLDVKLSLYDLTTAMKTIQFFIFPGLLADNIKNQYPAVADVLKKATTKPVYHMDTEEMDNPWEDAAICNEDGTLALDWGIDAAADEDKEEAFLDAAQAALSGLEPLLLALISNKGISGTHTDNDNDIANDGKPGHGKVGTGSTSIKILISISVTVDPINLFLDISGNEGYNNAIVPILEALGLDADQIPDGNTFTSTKQILKEGLIEPIKALLTKVAADPVDYVLTYLPNLAYAVEAGRIVPLLSMLKTDINYHADAHYSAVAGLAAGDINEALSDGPISINIGEMIDLEDLGLDISSFNAVLDLVAGLLGEGIELPAMKSGVLASLGTLTQIATERSEKTYAWGDADKAAFIEANRADVLLFLFDYVIEAIKAQPTIIEDIVNAVQASKAEEEAAAAAEAGEEYIAPEPFVMPEEVTAILNNVLNGYDKAENKFDALAALAELIFPVEYTTTADELVYDSTALDPDYMITDLHTGETKVVFDSDVEYTEWWTEEKAQYVADNLQTFIDNIIMMFGVKIGDVKVESLSETVTELVNTLYAPETVNELAATLAGLLDGLEIEDDLKTLLMGIIADNLGDISVWDGYEADFEAGDKDGFVAAMTEVLAPVEKVLQFILTDENLTVSLNGADGKFQVIELPGYMGYTYGLIPLFEALGAEDVMDTDAFAADKDNIIANLLNTLTGIVDTVAADPYAAIENILPNLLYFVESDGIQVAIDNLLYPVNQALEVIAPIYKVNLNELLPFDITFAGIDPVSFLFTELEAMAYEATGIDFDFDFTAAELLNDLTFGEMLTYTSATGKEAYKVAPGALTADMVTVILRFLLEEAMFSDNMSSLINWARVTYELPDEIYYPLYAFFYGLFTMKDTHIDYALGIAYYAFFGANTAVEAVADYYQYMRYDWQAIAETLKGEDMTDLEKAAYIFKEVYNTTGMTLLDSLHDQGKSPISSGFFAKIKEMLQAFLQLFKTIFSGFSQIGK